jgi:hypothetical protein
MSTSEVNTQLGEREEEEITYHAVEKEGVITAIWEMKGKRHLRTIDPHSEEGRRILEAYKPNE